MKLRKPFLLMLVDDNFLDLKINSKVAQHTNLFDEVIQFSSGEMAINYLIENSDKPDKIPSLILLDIKMPIMDGFEFVEKYALLPSSIIDKCLIAILSSTEDYREIKKIESNPLIVQFIHKPIRVNTLNDLVSQFYTP